MAYVYFITHADVLVDPATPVPQWGLSPRGEMRMRALLAQPWVPNLGAVWCSTERKAIIGAEIISNAIHIKPRLLAELGENDRSATGYLPKFEFEATADAFFANPHDSIRGWEKAADAQRRILAAVTTVMTKASADRDIAVVSHGGVGALLLCHLKRYPISRAQDQPGEGGGNYFCFERTACSLTHGWRPIDDQAS